MNYFIYNNKNKNQFLRKINTDTPPTNFSSTTVEYPQTSNGYTRCFNTETNSWSDEIKDYRGIKIYYIYNSLNNYICNSVDLPEGYSDITPPNSVISYQLNIKNNQWQLIAASDFESTPNNVTKFQVYANAEVIPAGSSIPELSKNYTTSVEIPIGMTHEFSLDIFGDLIQSDVTIDWGDGNITKVCEETSKTFNHTYIKTGKYLITIAGEKYNRIKSTSSDKNLICRIFEHDLPTTAKLRKASSLCAGALRLIELDCTYNDTFKKLINFPYLFLNCQNLKKAVGFPDLTYVQSVNGIFSSCHNLITTDFKLPEFSDDYSAVFAACYELTTPIDKLLPTAGFALNTINLTDTFTGLANSSISDIDNLNNKLLQNKNLKFTGTLSSYFGTTYAGPSGVTIKTNINILNNIATEYGGTNDTIPIIAADSIPCSHNIFDIFYSLSKVTPPGAMDLSLGTLILNCDKVFPDFWSECLQRRGNIHMFPQFNGNFYYYWSGRNVIGNQGIDGFNGNSVCYYNGKIYVLAQGDCDGHETPPSQSQEWRQFIVPTEQWVAQSQYSIGDTVLYNEQIWCARGVYIGAMEWNGIGIAPGQTDADGTSYWALYDLPTQIVVPTIRTLTEEEWQVEANSKRILRCVCCG